MSHIYQPVMLIELLKNKGRSSVSNIAKQFLKYDEAQIEYYQHVTKIMPGKVLTNNLEIISKNVRVEGADVVPQPLYFGQQAHQHSRLRNPLNM